MASSAIPTFYRVVFLYVDPFFCALGAALHFFAPDQVMAGYHPAYSTPISLEVRLLLDWLACFFAMLGLIQYFLLRARPNDVEVWRILQGSTAVLDFVTVIACLRALHLQGRLDPQVWTGGEWQNIGGNIQIGLVRVLFVAGVGCSAADKIQPQQIKSKKRA